MVQILHILVDSIKDQRTASKRKNRRISHYSGGVHHLMAPPFTSCQQKKPHTFRYAAWFCGGGSKTTGQLAASRDPKGDREGLPTLSTWQVALSHQELVYRARSLAAFAQGNRSGCRFTRPQRATGKATPPYQRGRSLSPIRNSSTARAAWRPSRIAHTTSDWPRRMSPAANTLSTLVA